MISRPRKLDCLACAGSGLEFEELERCPQCDGTGEFSTPDPGRVLCKRGEIALASSLGSFGTVSSGVVVWISQAELPRARFMGWVAQAIHNPDPSIVAVKR